jgi:hypothetical protein
METFSFAKYFGEINILANLQFMPGEQPYIRFLEDHLSELGRKRLIRQLLRALSSSRRACESWRIDFRQPPLSALRAVLALPSIEWSGLTRSLSW